MFEKINIALCDDDAIYLEQEYDLVCTVMEEIGIKYEIDKYNSPIDLLDSNTKYDIIFVDIEMKQLNGLETMRRIHLKNRNCHIFGVSNHEEYMDDALNVEAIRYWIKPIDRYRLLKTLRFIIKQIEEKRQIVDVIVNNKTISIEAKNIIYICATKKKTAIITTKGTIIAGEPLKNVINKLKENTVFCITHASYMVNLTYVESYKENYVICNYEDKIYNVDISKRRYRQFKEKFIQWLTE